MPSYSKQIVNYTVLYQPLNDIHAYINCYSGTGEHVCRLAFYDDTRPVPIRNDVITGTTIPGVVFRSSQFMAILTLLREEKPIFLAWNPDTLNGFLNTGFEPVGEDEGP